MRKVNIVFLVGLCVGALAVLVVAVTAPRQHIAPALALAPIASAATHTETEQPTVDLAALVPDGHVSAVVFDRVKGTTVLSVDADRTYTSASLVKLMIAFQALDDGAAPAEVTRMLERSDDDIASRLWVTHGWGSIVDTAARRMGLTNTHPPANPGHWGDTQLTAHDVTTIYRYLMDRAPTGDRKIILNALHHATELGADGFRQFFGIPDAAGAGNFAVKQGWSCCEPEDSIELHTSGLVYGDRYLVTVLTQQPAADGYTTAAQRVTAVVRKLLPLLHE